MKPVLKTVENLMAPSFHHRGNGYFLVTEQLWLEFVSNGNYLCCHPVGFCRYYEHRPKKMDSLSYGRSDGTNSKRVGVFR